MKIAYIYPFKAFPPKGGNHLHALQLIRQFQAMGHEVCTWGDDTVAGVRCFARDAQGLAALEQEAHVFYVRFDGNPVGSDTLLARLLDRTERPVVWEINAPANEGLAFSYLGGNRKRHAGLLKPLDSLRRHLHAARQRPRILREEALRKRLAKRAHAAMCVSSALARYARDGLGFEHAIVVPNGADPEAQSPEGPVAMLEGVPTQHLKILYAGSPIYPWQGLDILSETAALCEKNHDPVHFLALLNQESPQLAASGNVSVLVKIPHEDVPSFLRLADAGVVIHPDFSWSRWGSYVSPMKMFEYMACGLPVLGSNIGQMAEIIEPGRNGMLFEYTPEALRACLLEAAGQRASLKTMGANARADVVTRYNWREVARRTVETLEAAITEQRARGSQLDQ